MYALLGAYAPRVDHAADEATIRFAAPAAEMARIDAALESATAGRVTSVVLGDGEGTDLEGG